MINFNSNEITRGSNSEEYLVKMGLFRSNLDYLFKHTIDENYSPWISDWKALRDLHLNYFRSENEVHQINYKNFDLLILFISNQI